MIQSNNSITLRVDDCDKAIAFYTKEAYGTVAVFKDLQFSFEPRRHSDRAGQGNSCCKLSSVNLHLR